MVVLAADSASASSRPAEERDHVVMLTQPSTAPVIGSSTGTAAQRGRAILVP